MYIFSKLQVFYRNQTVTQLQSGDGEERRRVRGDVQIREQVQFQLPRSRRFFVSATSHCQL